MSQPSTPVPSPAGAATLRWSARLLSLLIIGALLLFVFGEGLDLLRLTRREMLLFACFPAGMIAGFLLAWRWPGVGGLLSVLSIAAFYGIHLALDGKLPRGPAFLVFSTPAILFLVESLLHRRNAGAPSSASHAIPSQTQL